MPDSLLGDSDAGLDGRYLIAVTDAAGARDGIALTTQVKYMRDMAERNGWKPSLILVVVDEDHMAEASERIQGILNGDTGEAREVVAGA